MDSVIKMVREKADEANLCGKLTSLYQVLNDVQARISELEKQIPEAFWDNDKQE